LGVESEKVEETLLRVQSAMALAQGLAGLEDAGRAFKQLGVVASEALKGIRTGVAATGIGVLLVALGAVVAYWEEISATLGIVTEEQKKLNDAQEQQRKIADEQTQSVKKESAEFVGLVSMLKATNANSKEREILIKKINTQYGTTLQNLKDEKTFQNQLNLAVQEYIQQKYNEFSLKANEEALVELFEKKNKATKEFNKQINTLTDGYTLIDAKQGLYLSNTAKSDKVLDSTTGKYVSAAVTLGQLRDANSTVNSVLLKQEKIMRDSDKTIEHLSKSNLKLGVSNKIVSETIDDVGDKTDKTKETIKDYTKEIVDAQINLIADENQRQQTKLISDAEFRKKDIENSNADEKQKATLIKAINEQLLIDLDKLDTEYYNKKLEKEKQLILAQENSELIYQQIAMSKIQFDKEMALKDIDNSNKTEEEKKKLRLETLKYYKNIEIKQANELLSIQSQMLYNKYQNDLKLAKEKGESTLQIDAQYQKDLLDLEQDTALKIKNIQGQITQEREKTFTDNVKFAEEQLALWGGKVMEIADAINSLLAQQTQQQIDNINTRYTTESDKLQSLYDQRILSEEEFNAQKKVLDQQKEQDEIALKRKQFRRDKAFNLANAIMNGAQAVLQALSSSPPPINFILAGLAGVAAGVQIATISQQQFKAARGGIVPGNGPSNIDSVPSLLAPGEAVINANSAAMFPNTLSMINQAGGGVSLAPEMPTQGSSGSGTIFTDNRSNQPLRAYVVETEITSSQKRVNRIERSVEF